jgi:hypothetical protein
VFEPDLVRFGRGERGVQSVRRCRAPPHGQALSGELAVHAPADRIPSDQQKDDEYRLRETGKGAGKAARDRIGFPERTEDGEGVPRGKTDKNRYRESDQEGKDVVETLQLADFTDGFLLVRRVAPLVEFELRFERKASSRSCGTSSRRLMRFWGVRSHLSS